MAESDAAQKIRDSVAEVARLRAQRIADPSLGAQVLAIKRWQARRFQGTYADLLISDLHGGAARFFLEELYGDRDFADRDAQFARIAGTMQKLFPEPVVETALALAELHALTETLDHAMGVAWAAQEVQAARSEAGRYVQAWRAVGQRAERTAQLRVVLTIGRDLARLTRMPGLRLLLKMMRGPAAAAGMASLQHFLEAGFDTFGALARRKDGAEVFMRTIEERESALIAQLFDDPPVTCETNLVRILGQAR